MRSLRMVVHFSTFPSFSGERHASPGYTPAGPGDGGGLGRPAALGPGKSARFVRAAGPTEAELGGDAPTRVTLRLFLPRLPFVVVGGGGPPTFPPAQVRASPPGSKLPGRSLAGRNSDFVAHPPKRSPIGQRPARRPKGGLTFTQFLPYFLLSGETGHRRGSPGQASRVPGISASSRGPRPGGGTAG